MYNPCALLWNIITGNKEEPKEALGAQKEVEKIVKDCRNEIVDELLENTKKTRKPLD